MEFTPGLNLELPDFDQITWHDEVNGNFIIIDAAITALTGLGVSGAWENATDYVIGDRVVDTDLGSLWICLVDNTSASTGTFAADRTANPTYWEQITTLPIVRGAWAQSTSYAVDDVVYDTAEGLFAIATEAHTSAGSGTLRDDISHWLVIVDLGDIINDAQDAADAAAVSEANAASSASAASTSAGNASTSASAASASASAAATSASAASTSASAALTSATNAANSASAASTSASNAATSETNAAASASSAATSYDNFDDRFLGSKAADPTLDNDGNALLTGALYWNSGAAEMRVYNGSAWVALATTARAVRTVTAAGAITADAVTDDIILVNKAVGAATVVNLPAASTRSTTKPLKIVDKKGDADTNNITVTPNGADTIIGEATWVINTQKGGVEIYSDGVSEWYF